MLGVELRDGESIESALRRFKREIERDGILTDYKKHTRYEKPSEKRKRKLAAIRRKIEKKLKKIKGLSKFV